MAITALTKITRPVVDDSLFQTSLSSDGQPVVTTDTYVGGFKNLIINGDMRINQRTTSTRTLSSWNQYLVDRSRTGGNVLDSDNLIEYQMSNITSVETAANHSKIYESNGAPTGFVSSLKYEVTKPRQIAENHKILWHSHFIEGYDSWPLKMGESDAKSFTASFWIRSNKTGKFQTRFHSSGQVPSTQVEYNTLVEILNPNTWEYKTITVPACTIGKSAWNKTTGVGLRFDICLLLPNTSGDSVIVTTDPTNLNKWTYNATQYQVVHYNLPGMVDFFAEKGNTLYITGVQIEVGDKATAFEYRPLQIELNLCRRYYEVGSTFRSMQLGCLGNSEGYLSDSLSPINPTYEEWHSFQVAKRANPTITADCWVLGDGYIQPEGTTTKIVDPDYGQVTLYDAETGNYWGTTTGRSKPLRATGNPEIEGYTSFLMLTGGSNVGYHFPSSSYKHGWISKPVGEQPARWYQLQTLHPNTAQPYYPYRDDALRAVWDTAPYIYNWRASCDF